MARTSLRDRLDAGDDLLGSFVKSSDPLITEVLAASGLDVLVIDLEHSTLDVGEVAGLQRGADAFGCPTIVRLPPDRLGDAGRALEAGTSGVQVSSVETLDDVRRARRALRLAPEGALGLSLTHRAARFGRTSAEDYTRRLHDETILVVQVESRTGIDALPGMLELPDGPDVVFFGPMDLSASLGHPGDPGHPAVQTAIERAAAGVRRAGRPFGLFVTSPAEAARWRGLGARFVLLGADLSLLGERATELAGAWSA